MLTIQRRFPVEIRSRHAGAKKQCRQPVPLRFKHILLPFLSIAMRAKTCVPRAYPIRSHSTDTTTSLPLLSQSRSSSPTQHPTRCRSCANNRRDSQAYPKHLDGQTMGRDADNIDGPPK
jgi:hypothetical protein